MTKIETLIARLREGWVASETLQRDLGWRSHTLRGALSNLSRKRKLRIERKREEGVTQYRIADTAPGRTKAQTAALPT